MTGFNGRIFCVALALTLGAVPVMAQSQAVPSKPDQAARAYQGFGPQQGFGPLHGAGPLQARGPILGTGPLVNSNPASGTTPVQGSGR